jgi:hypothetical protein
MVPSNWLAYKSRTSEIKRKNQKRNAVLDMGFAK